MAPTKIGFYSMALVFLFANSYGQESRKHILDEFTFSINKSRVADHYTEDRWGFGFGAYHSFFPKNRPNLLLGLEFNQVRQFKYSAFSGRMFDYKDLTYIFNGISVPLGLRFNTGDEAKVFIEPGGFVDIPICSRRKGTITSYHIIPNQEYRVITTTFDQKEGLIPSLGVYLGAGIRIPLPGFEMIIKFDYRHGINNMNLDPDYLYGRYLRLAIGLKLI